MSLYTYIVARDFGFAPNPFFGVCTLATCKPEIRRSASVGDWVVGTGAKTKYDLAGRLIYAMKVDETLSLSEYWNDQRFLVKRPTLNGSLKQVYGDNIYNRIRGRWKQADSHHSLDKGRRNYRNIARDTKADRMLVGRRFTYFGASAVTIPKRFRPFRRTGEDLCCKRQGYRVLSEAIATAFEAWLNGLDRWGLQGLPLEFEDHKRNDVP